MVDETAVAIVGMACRLPGAANVDQYWANLCAGADGISRFGPDDLARAGVDPATARRPDYVAARGLVPAADQFDWPFFGYSPAEAAMIDPQQRVFLECASQAVDDAGIDPRRFPGWIGVFAGSDPVLVGVDEDADLTAQVIGQDKDYLATRVAYKLGLRGPAITVQTACSTSLTAVHTACQSLLGYECDVALAGGVSVSLPQQRGYLYQEGGILSPDGHCRPFDADAAGTVSSEGVGVVVLKRLADALRDNDRVVAVLRGSAVNNDGREKIGFTAPSVTGQRAVIQLALEQAQVDPADLGYVEAHGTGTRVGDPVEVQALTSVFRESTSATGRCWLGSVKGNIGHTGAAAGVAGLIKTALLLERGELVPTAHYRRPNPLLDLAATPFEIADRRQEWPRDRPRLAGVSSFGIGGTNVHAVLAAPPTRTRAPERRRPRLIGVSAASASGLDRLRTDLADRLRSGTELRLDDVALTLAAGRRRFEHRLAVVAEDRDQAQRLLRAAPTHTAASPPRVAFLFPGQATLRHGAGAAAHRVLPGFRAHFDEIADRVRREHEIDLSPVVADTADPAWFVDTVHQQLGLFALGHALGRQLLDWGLTPEAMLGNSIGEYVAAALAGVWTLPDALTLVAARARAMRATPPGRMVSVAAPEAEITRRLGHDERVVVAVAGPGAVVLSGAAASVEEVLAEGRLDGLEVRHLDADRAFHSALMDPAAEALREVAATLPSGRPGLRLVSNLSGAVADPERLGQPDYWAEHLRRPVRLTEGIATLLAEGCSVFVELGPGSSMTGAARRHPSWDSGHAAVPLLGSKPEAAESALLTGLGALWERGLDIPVEDLLAEDRPRRCALPPHPFEPLVPRARAPRTTAPRPAGRSGEELTTPVWVQSTPARSGRHDLVAVLAGESDAHVDGVLAGLAGESDAHVDGVLAGLAGEAATVHRQAGDCARPEVRAAFAATVERLLAKPATAPAVLVALPVELDGALIDWLDSLADQVAPLAGVALVVVGRGLTTVLGTERTRPGAAALTSWLRSRPAGLIQVLDVGDDDPVTTIPRSDGGPGLHAWRGRRWWTLTAQPVPGDHAAAEPAEREFAVVTSGRADGAGLAARLAESGVRVAAYAGDDVEPTPLPLAEGLPAALEAARRGREGRAPALSARPDLRARLDHFCAGLLGQFALDFGKVEPGTTIAGSELRERLDPSGMLPRFIDFVVSVLVEQGWLLPEGPGFAVEPRMADQVAEAVGAAAGLDELAGLRRILEHCASSYPAVFSGAMERVSVLYPDGQPTMLRDCLTDNAVDPSGDVAVCIETVCRAVRAVHAQRPGTKLRILEIGAGQGGLTWPLLEDWADRDGVHYHFTDISLLMVRQAREHAEQRGWDNLSYSVLDLARDPVEQNIAAGSYDLILAYNAVHVAPRIRQALRHLGELLRPGGSLCVVESVEIARWAHVLWGLTPGWWDFGDERENGIMLDATAWTSALADSGFVDVTASPAGPGADHVVLHAATPAATGSSWGDRVGAALRAAARRDSCRGVLYLPEVGHGDDDPNGPARNWALISGTAEAAGLPSWWVITEDQRTGAGWRAEARRDELDPPAAAPLAWRHLRVAHLGPEEVAGLPRLLAGDDLPGSVRFAPAPAEAAATVAEFTEPDPTGSAAPPEQDAPSPVGAAGDPVRHAVARLWCEVLGVPSVTDTDDFFALGGESLMAVHFMGRIRTRTGAHVPPAAFTRSSTFGQLLDLVRRAGATAEAASPAETRTDITDLLVFKEGGPRAPVFLAAPAAGTTLSYQSMADLLDDDRPVYGIEPVLSPARAPHVTVEDVAAHHVELIQRVRPHGPYVLGGWSFGAVVAHEMARQLVERGEEVEKLLFIDGYAPNTGGQPIRKARGFMLGGLWYQASAALGLGAAGDLVRASAELRRVFNANIRAMWRYRPAPLPCSAVVLKTRLDPLRAWWLRRSLATLYGGEVHVRPVPGSHWTLLNEPHVRRVAAEVRRSLAGNANEVVDLSERRRFTQ
uniref:EpxE n=1 Tax=Goodfellowiella coeruleoviolacea TaxID=334858 RepID=V5RMU0_9PSEU|nr:EpxE [Goodfellowiella coeruleoviolacea]